MDEKHTVEDRVIQLESVVAHLQYDVEKLNEVLVEHQAALTRLKQELEELRLHFDAGGTGEEQRDPADDRPPHY